MSVYWNSFLGDFADNLRFLLILKLGFLFFWSNVSFLLSICRFSDYLVQGVGNDSSELQSFLVAYASCHGVNPPKLKPALLVFKTGGDYFTLVVSDPASATAVVAIKADDGTHRAWKLFESAVALRLFLTNKTKDYEAEVNSTGDSAYILR